MVELCRKILKGSAVKIYALAAYPHGIFLAGQKAEEIRELVSLGVNGVEVCINTLNVRSGDWTVVREEMQECRKAADGVDLKYILEMEWLTDSQITECCKIALEEKVDCIVTSTGLYNKVDENRQDVPIYVTEKDVKLLKSIIGGKIKIMAQGCIVGLEMADRLIEAGADYLGVEHTLPFVLGG
jgi:deoxyribose-phosphate aldolase